MKPKSKPVAIHQPCPVCGGSDSASIWADGNGHCHSHGCKFTTEGTNQIEAQVSEKKPTEFRPLPEVYHEWPERGLTAGTCRKFGVTVVQDPDSKAQAILPRVNTDGKHVANKIRYRDKGFSFEGNPKGVAAFGRQLFPAGGKFITITEGLEDAMAAYQMFGSRYPAVGVDSTSEAYNQLKDDWEYYNSFETIVINFDNDSEKIHPDGTRTRPGQEAAVKCAALFGLGKVRILTLADAKDANDYLLKGWAEKYTKEWWAAPVWTPTGLKLGKDMWDEISAEVKYETVNYPWPSANEMTYGMRLSEVVLLTADTGIGKTQIAKEIEYNILKETAQLPVPPGVGLLHLEETNRDTALGLMSLAANKPLHLPDVRADVDNDELRRYYDESVNSDRVVIWDHFGSNTVEEVLAKIRHMVALGCKYIFLDHLSIVVSDQSGDERKQLDEISTKLKTICMELNIAVFAIIHINRQGMVRGSAGPEQIANIVFYASRDKTDPDPWRRNVTKIVCTKNRFCGRTGPMTYLIYDMFTNRLREMDREEIGKFEAGGGMPLEEQWQ